jgi:type I restriction enzyme M protein
LKLEKYSKRATLQEIIAENDYNLNIPRYVDTFEAEESIDINAIAKKLPNTTEKLWKKK